MKLWTYQDKQMLETDHPRNYFADWNRTPQNWRGLYRWMCRQWEARVEQKMSAAPIWCWHSCDGMLGSEPNIGTFLLLMCDWDYYASRMMAVQLEVPDNFALLSSYSRWNDAMGDAIERRLDDIDTARFIDMFDPPLLRHDTDDIQAVIPYIDVDWITDVRDFPSCQEAELDWDWPFARFPKRESRR